jgi:hypothetical protein
MSIAARSRYLERGNRDLFCVATLYPIASPIILNESTANVPQAGKLTEAKGADRSTREA